MIGSDLLYLCLENTRGAIQPREPRKSCGSVGSFVLLVRIVVFRNELGLWEFVPTGGFFGVFGENYCFFKIIWDFVQIALVDFHQRRFREGIQKKIEFFLGKSPKLWVGGGQES